MYSFKKRRVVLHGFVKKGLLLSLEDLAVATALAVELAVALADFVLRTLNLGPAFLPTRQ